MIFTGQGNLGRAQQFYQQIHAEARRQGRAEAPLITPSLRFIVGSTEDEVQRIERTAYECFSPEYQAGWLLEVDVDVTDADLDGPVPASAFPVSTRDPPDGPGRLSRAGRRRQPDRARVPLPHRQWLGRQPSSAHPNRSPTRSGRGSSPGPRTDSCSATPACRASSDSSSSRWSRCSASVGCSGTSTAAPRCAIISGLRCRPRVGGLGMTSQWQNPFILSAFSMSTVSHGNLGSGAIRMTAPPTTRSSDTGWSWPGCSTGWLRPVVPRRRGGPTRRLRRRRRRPHLTHGVQTPVTDPLLAVSAMAAATSRLGFGITVSTTYESPYLLARKFSTLDHLTDGRIGWNIVTSLLDSAARNILGRDRGRFRTTSATRGPRSSSRSPTSCGRAPGRTTRCGVTGPVASTPTPPRCTTSVMPEPISAFPAPTSSSRRRNGRRCCSRPEHRRPDGSSRHGMPNWCSPVIPRPEVLRATSTTSVGRAAGHGRRPTRSSS